MCGPPWISRTSGCLPVAAREQPALDLAGRRPSTGARRARRARAPPASSALSAVTRARPARRPSCPPRRRRPREGRRGPSGPPAHDVLCRADRDGVARRQVVAIRREPLGLAAVDRAPATARSCPSTGARNRAWHAVGRDGRTRGPSPIVTSLFIAGVGLELAGREQVRAAAGPRVRPVGGEPPQPGAVEAAREPLAHGEDRLCRRGSRPGSKNSVSVPPVIVVTSPDATSTTKIDGPAVEVVVAAAVRRERDPACRRATSAGDASGVGPATSGRAAPVADVDEPQVAVLVVDEAGAVELVAEAVEVAVVGPRRSRRAWAWAAGRGGAPPRRGSRRASCVRTASVVPSGDQANSVTPRGRSVRRRASPPVERQQVDLGRVLALLGVLRAVGLLLDEQAAVREEGERRAVRREPGVAVGLASPRVSAAGRRASRRPGPTRRTGGSRRAPGLATLTVNATGPAVRREARVVRDGDPVQVVGARGTRHGLLQRHDGCPAMRGGRGPA